MIDGRSRIVVTGLGLITPIGHTVAEFWHNLSRGVSGAGPITRFDASKLSCRIAAEVKDFDPTQYMDAKVARRAARFTQFAVAAIQMALNDARLTIDDHNAESVGMVINTGAGGLDEIYTGVTTYLERGPSRVSPLLIPSMIPNMASCQASVLLGVKGPVITSTAACAAGIHALIEAKRLLDLGEADVVVAGGSEAAIIPPGVASLDNLGALSRQNNEPEKACRPFDLHRNGFVLGEGAAVMVLERLEHAVTRGVPIYAELMGGAVTTDGYHITAPDPTGQEAARAISLALKNARMNAAEISYIVAHGTGTPLNDASETVSIKKALGEHAYRVPISSPKSMVGHLLGAAGAISAVTGVLAIRDGLIPPTINLDTPDPDCDLDYVPNVARKAQVRSCMANGFGFGGQNGVVIFKEYRERI